MVSNCEAWSTVVAEAVAVSGDGSWRWMVMQGEGLRCLRTRGKLFDPAISVRARWTSRRCVLMAVFQCLAYRGYPCMGCSSSGVQVGLRVPSLHHLVDCFGTAIIQVQIIIVSFLCVFLVISLFLYVAHQMYYYRCLSPAISLCLLYFCFCCHCPSSYPCLVGGRRDPLR